MLGRVIEAVTGRQYHEFVRTELWDQLKIPKEEIGFGRSLLGEEEKNEVAYCAHAAMLTQQISLTVVMGTWHLWLVWLIILWFLAVDVLQMCPTLTT